MYSVYQHWDKLKVCVVGKSYPPEFYNYISNPRVRNVMERIAIETEEDYQKLIKLLESFNVEVLRPKINLKNTYDLKRTHIPPMNPRDVGGMFGNKFFLHPWNGCYDEIIEKVKSQGNAHFFNNKINTAMITRVGKDLYFGQFGVEHLWKALAKKIDKQIPDKIPKKFEKNYVSLNSTYYKSLFAEFQEYRNHIVDTGGHNDGAFCPVIPGLIVSLRDIQVYEKTFPNWEVVYLPNQSWDAVRPFLQLKDKNHGKWWVPGEELNDDFTEFVETWLSHWVGYVEETVFDVNMLVIDEKNVVCNNYNKKVFDAFKRYGITPHIINFRHRYFWDGGLHCITLDLDREGTMVDYFPERGN